MRRRGSSSNKSARTDASNKSRQSLESERNASSSEVDPTQSRPPPTADNHDGRSNDNPADNIPIQPTKSVRPISRDLNESSSDGRPKVAEDFVSASEGPASNYDPASDEPEPWFPDDPLHYPAPKQHDQWGREQGAFDALWQAVQKHDDDMCKAWKEDSIDTLLVFAGLLSAVVTAFTVEISPVLKPASKTHEQVVALLVHISQRLADSGVDPAGFSTDSDGYSRREERVTIMWFLSVILSLAAALIGILAKQWIREYQADIAESPKDALQRQQLRYEALLQWRVLEIIASLPVLIEVAVVFSLAGMIDFLWGFDRVVAISLTVVISIVLFVILTTVLPAIFYPTKLPVAFYKDIGKRNPSKFRFPLLPCPFHSPQSYAFRLIADTVFSRLTAILWGGASVLLDGRIFWSRTLKTWVEMESHLARMVFIYEYPKNTMRWIRENLVTNPWITGHFFYAAQEEGFQSIADYKLCSEHAFRNPYFIWTSEELEMLDRRTAIEICIHTIKLLACQDCRPPNAKPDEPFTRLWSLLGRTHEVLPEDLYVQAYLTIQEEMESGRLHSSSFFTAWHSIKSLWMRNPHLPALQSRITKTAVPALQSWSANTKSTIEEKKQAIEDTCVVLAMIPLFHEFADLFHYLDELMVTHGALAHSENWQNALEN